MSSGDPQAYEGISAPFSRFCGDLPLVAEEDILGPEFGVELSELGTGPR